VKLVVYMGILSFYNVIASREILSWRIDFSYCLSPRIHPSAGAMSTFDRLTVTDSDGAPIS